MHPARLSLLLSLGLGAGTLSAQQSMPGMDMPTPPAASPGIAPSTSSRGTGKRGEQRSPPSTQKEQRTAAQQAEPARPDPGTHSDQSSTALPFQTLQEPEAEGFHTGTDLPAAELLREVVDRPPMTLDQFLTLAVASNPLLAQARQEVKHSQALARQAGLPPNPTLGYSGEHIRGGSYHGGEEGAFFSQDIVLGHKLALRRDIYRAEGRSNEFALAVQQTRVRDDVARAFFHALAAQQTVLVRDRLLKVALDTERNTHELERVGQADAPAVLDAEVTAEQAKLEFESSQRQFLSDLQQLATVAGKLTFAPRPLTGPLVEPPAMDAQALLATALGESPAVKQAQGDVEVAQARLKSAKREPVPDLNVKAGEWYSGETLNGSNKQAGPMGFAEASVQIPLWNRNQGNIQAAEAELAQAGQEVRRVQLQIRSAAEPLVQQYETARSGADRYRTAILPRARRAYDLQVLKYQEMAQAYPQVLTAQRTLFNLQLNYLHELDEQWSAALLLENYTLMNSLETTPDAPAGGSTF